MLKAGADGVLEAIVLSIGALKFTTDHLEFGERESSGWIQSPVYLFYLVFLFFLSATELIIPGGL